MITTCHHRRWMVEIVGRDRTYICLTCQAKSPHEFPQGDCCCHCNDCESGVHYQDWQICCRPAPADEPLRADHPAVVYAQKQGHENGWNAAGAALRDMRDELTRCRAECQHLNYRLDEATEAIATAREQSDREAGLNLSTPVEDKTTRLSSAPATDHEHDWIEAGEPYDPQCCGVCGEVRR